jgi:DNA-binding IclR family transcriptional regulator
VATRTQPDRQAVAVGSGASSIRRAVGPTAWAVLECLAEFAVVHGDEAVSHQSVRGLSSELNLAKDTVARAVRRLVDEQLVSYVARRNAGGRFGPGYYRLDLPHDVLVPVEAFAHSSTPPPRARATRSRHTTNSVQLSLIDLKPSD